MKTAVVILNYNGINLLKKYLPIVKSTTKGDIIVADNGSNDGSAEWLKENLPNEEIILFDKNWGFAEGYNKAFEQIKGKYEYYLLLNSDVRTTENWLTFLEEYMDSHPACAALQPKILAEKEPQKFEYAGACGGFIDYLGYPFCRGRIMDNVEKDEGQYDTDCEIFWASGAAMMIRADLYHQMGGLDGRFFAHQEEIDLCWRIKSRGFSIVCTPKSVVYHIGGASLDYQSPFKTKLNFRNNALLLYKNMEQKRYWFVYPMRVILDYVACAQMYCSGQRESAKAVIQARKEFKQMKVDFKADRELNLRLTTTKRIAGILNQSLLFQVYIGRKKNFNKIIGKV